jgi:hypothetical protein
VCVERERERENDDIISRRSIATARHCYISNGNKAILLQLQKSSVPCTIITVVLVSAGCCCSGTDATCHYTHSILIHTHTHTYKCTHTHTHTTISGRFQSLKTLQPSSFLHLLRPPPDSSLKLQKYECNTRQPLRYIRVCVCVLCVVVCF